MATREELQQLARLRLREAEALFAAGLYDGCVYLCGYVVELALKARMVTYGYCRNVWTRSSESP